MNLDPDSLSLIGSGAFGQVHKAVWRGIVVAEKVIPLVAGQNSKVIDNELNAYKYVASLLCNTK